MEIMISKVRVLRAVILASVLVVVIGGIYWMKSTGLINRFFINTHPTQMPGIDMPAMQAVAALYSPDESTDQKSWEDSVCANMTMDGCQLFQKLYAPSIWSAAQSRKTPSNISIAFIQVTEIMKDGSQVWKLQLTADSNPSIIYIQVVQGPDTKQWLLERVIFSQEAEARYGE